MNKALLRETAAKIEARPRQFNMSSFFSGNDSVGNEASHCGTACCIAGWGITLAKTKSKRPSDGEEFINQTYREAHPLFGNYYHQFHENGKEVFELTESQADRLFTWMNGRESLDGFTMTLRLLGKPPRSELPVSDTSSERANSH